MRVFLTGASSFTGCHIARALVDAGHDVRASFTRAPADYADVLVSRRLGHARLSERACVHEAPFGSDAFLRALRDFRPDAFVNHGADIKGYRNPDFDVARSVAASLKGAESVFALLAEVGCRRVVHSGSVFEPIDGLPALSPYGQSKGHVSEAVERLCAANALSFSKIYIPNPIGPFENDDRMIPLFVKKWKQGERPLVSAPKAVWDHLPAPWLARAYVEECAAPGSETRLRRPSGFAVELVDFVRLFVEEARHAGVTLPLAYDVSENAQAPAPRLNTETCPELDSPDARRAFFGAWMRSLFFDDEEATAS